MIVRRIIAAVLAASALGLSVVSMAAAAAPPVSVVAGHISSDATLIDA